MRLLKLTAALFLLLAMPFARAKAQAWSGILDPSRATDWTQAGVQGGIPAYSTICQTVAPSGDTTGATDPGNINNALSACGASASASSPKVVLLQAGTYYLNIAVNFNAISYVVLRGAGPDKTVMKWVGNNDTVRDCGHLVDICVAGSSYAQRGYMYHGGTTDWKGTNDVIGTYTPGATLLDVASTSGIVAGLPVNLDQRNDDVGLCPQTGGVGNCAGVTGLTNSGTTVTAVTSVPHGFIAGQQVMIGDLDSQGNGSLNDGGGYEGTYTIASVPSSPVCSDAFGNSGPCSFTYTDTNALSSPADSMYAAVDNGNVFICGIDAECILSNSSYIGRVCPDTTTGSQCASGEYSLRSQNEVHLVTAVCSGLGTGTGSATAVAQCKAANEIVVAGGIVAKNFRTSRDPGVWWTGSFPSQYAVYDGIESLTFDAYNDNNAYASVMLINDANCWLKNVRGLQADQEHVDIDTSSVHDAVVDSYFWGTAHGASESYGILMSVTSFSLIQNNIFVHVVAGIINDQTWGNVAAYNYLVDSGYVTTDWMMTQTSTNHGFAGYNLWEGNDTEFMDPDDIHGTADVLTFFRNRLRGQDRPGKFQSMLAAGEAAFDRGDNFIGNVMGTWGWETQYQTSAQIPPVLNGYVYNWQAGAGGVEDNGFDAYLPLDPFSQTTALRWGNWDTANGATQWNSAEIPTAAAWSSSTNYSMGALVTYSGSTWTALAANTNSAPSATNIHWAQSFINGNPVPANQNLPASFYLSGQPAFWSTPWGTPHWPAIGPDVTGAATGSLSDSPNSMSDVIPAQLCYRYTPIDPAYQQTFAVTGASYSGGSGVVTLTTAPLTLGTSTITVTGITPSAYNGIYEIQTDAPSAANVSPNIQPISGSGPPAGTYQIEITYVNPNGETTADTPDSITTSGSNLGINVPAPGNGAGNATGWNVYFTTAGGSTFYKQNSSPISLSTAWQQTTAINTSGAQPPTTDTATVTQVTYFGAQWTPLTPFATGATVLDSHGNVETATTGGISGSTQPTWPAIGNSVTDGSVTWTASSAAYVSGGAINWPNILLFNANRCYADEGAQVGGSFREGLPYN